MASDSPEPTSSPDSGTTVPDDTDPAPRRRRASRRSVLTGTGLVLAGAVVGGGGVALGERLFTSDTPTSEKDPATATLAEFGSTIGDPTVWQVTYELDDDETEPAVFTRAAQETRHDLVTAKKSDGSWSAADPLLILDPYGTTRTGLYVYFPADSDGTLSFTCSTSATADFTRTAANHADATGFEGLIVGLVPGAWNRLTLAWQPASGSAQTAELSIKAPATASGYGTQLAADIVHDDALSPGLFALSGVAGPGNSTFLVDNAGTMRAEVPGTDQAQHRFLLQDGRLVVATGASQVSVIDALGHAGTIVEVEGQSMHHDLVLAGDVAYALTSEVGSDQVEDRVVRFDLAAGTAAECVDLQKVFPEYEKIAHAREGGDAGGSNVTGKDWIHINTIQISGDTMYLSSRETSTIIALDDALEADSEPTVRWMLGAEGLWEGTGYEDHFFTAEGELNGNAGQHTVTRIDDDVLADGQFYLEMFNNNYWFLGTRDDGEWEDAGPANASTDENDGTSQMLRYLVDEKKGTYSEDFMVEVPYSTVVSSVVRPGEGTVRDNAVVNSGKSNVFGEYAADGTMLAEYRYDSTNYGYRVYKDAFEGFWYEY